MNVRETKLPGVLLFEPKIWGDPRGWFVELWRADRYAPHGLPEKFLQDNISWSTKGVLRGLHFQNPSTQGKLVFPLEGEIYDVAVDLRRSSRTFGQWVGAPLAASKKQQIWVPGGFAHGFVVTSDSALVVYKCTDLYDAKAEWGIRWDDPDLAIDWPVEAPVLSEKDKVYPRFKDLPAKALFD
jgi:dTDP-4-dehydrorhamnose 3,5-epimerase